MATKKATKKAEAKKDWDTNSKGFRKGYSEGVKGWQVFLQAMRMHVNINQYASAISADKKLIDYTIKGIGKQDAYLKANDIKVPKKLGGRRELALKGNHPSFPDTTAGWSKAVNQLVDLYSNKHIDKAGQSLIAKACQNAVSKASVKAKITNRLKKKVAELTA